MSVGDHGGRVIIFEYKSEGDEETVDAGGKRYPSLQFQFEF